MFDVLSFCARLLLSGVLAACAGDYADLVTPTVDEDPELPAVELSGTRFHAEAFGDPTDPVVVVLHGGPGGDYRGLLPLAALADDGYYVVFWDQRGTGLSRRHDCADVTDELYLRDLEAIVEHYSQASRVEQVALVGQSWGAMYATWFVNEHPDKVGPVVLAEPGAFTRAELDDYIERLITVSIFDEHLNDAGFMSRILTRDDHERADFQMAQLSTIVEEPLGLSTSDPEPFWRFGSVAAACLEESAGDFDWTTNLAAYQGRALFLHGAKNRVHSTEHQQGLAAHYPQAELVTLPGVGHDMIYAAPQASLAAVRAHLAGFGGAR